MTPSYQPNHKRKSKMEIFMENGIYMEKTNFGGNGNGNGNGKILYIEFDGNKWISMETIEFP